MFLFYFVTLQPICCLCDFFTLSVSGMLLQNKIFEYFSCANVEH